MITFITIIHIIVSFGLIAIVLLQAGRGAGLANIFGGGGSGMFAPSSGGPIAKITAGLAILFLITSLYLSLSTKTVRRSAILDKVMTQEETTVPATNSTSAPTSGEEIPLQE